MIHFTKMQGCGNDYIYIDGAAEKIPQEQKPDFVRRMSDRHFGIGGDGVIFVNPVEDPAIDFEMEMYNADGSRSGMCGNGIRCVAKFVYDKGLTDKTQVRIISGGSVKILDLTVENGKVTVVRVDMGEPILEAEKIPVRIPAAKSGTKSAVWENRKPADVHSWVMDTAIEVCGQTWRMNCISMGNPHAVVFADDVAGMDLEKIGPHFEHHTYFPERTNTEFVKVIDRSTVEMRVWERGSGETLACGTGCCATLAACVLNGLTDRKAIVRVLGGELEIEWDEQTNHIFMTGPAQTVFEGSVEY